MHTTAAVLFEHHQPLELVELEIPKLNAGQVLVEIHFSGVCQSQLMEIQGLRGRDPWLPHMLGHEAAGVVVDIGKNVTKVVEGDHVVLTWIRGRGMNAPGGIYKTKSLQVNSGAVTTFATLSIVSENRCIRIDKHVPLDVAALTGCAIPTGAGIVLNTINPSRHDSIAIWGAGGIGLSALLGAKVAGCETIIALDISDSSLKIARKLGATHIINNKTSNSLLKIFNIVGRSGVDYAVEASGKAEVIEQAFESVRCEGGLCIFASHPPHGSRIRIDPFDLISGKQIAGSWGGDSKPDEDIHKYLSLYQKKQFPINKLIANRFKLSAINEAIEQLKLGVPGRIMLEII